jgi:hypothetical protein
MHPGMYPTYQQDMQMASQGTQMASQSTQTVPPGTHMAPQTVPPGMYIAPQTIPTGTYVAPQTIPTGTHVVPQTIPLEITQNLPAKPKSNTTNTSGMSFDERVSLIGTAEYRPRLTGTGFELYVGDVAIEVSTTRQVRIASLVHMVTGPISFSTVAYRRVRSELLDRIVDPPSDWKSEAVKHWIPIRCVQPWAESQGLIGLIDRLKVIAWVRGTGQRN